VEIPTTVRFAALVIVLLSTALQPAQSPAAVARAPVKAAYLSYYGIAAPALRDPVFALLEHTELNGVVIDVKGDRGFIPYDTRVPLALDAGARGPVRMADFDAVLTRLKARGVYTVARIVVFKDSVLPRHRPEWAIVDRRTGAAWRDREGSAWIDPFREESWAYVIAIAREAALKGFDEIQFDYLRFPSDGRLGDARYARPTTQAARIETISRFLERAREGLRGTGALLAVDVFGYIAFNQNDTDIGQRVEDLAPLVDVLCPMAYPSAYHLGIPGYPNPVGHPYEIVFETVRRMRARTSQTRVQIRPWIQDFRDYAFDRRTFGVAEVRAQMQAARDAGAMGFMLWNPTNRYTADALGRRTP
jgi:hypothetical protein